MSRILLVTPYYPPEVGAAQSFASETAAYLAARGHEVTVLTTLPNYPSGIVPEEYRHGARRRELRDGVSIVRVWSYVTPNKGFFRRILGQLSFGCLAPFLGSRAVGKPEMILMISPPLFTAIAGRALAWRKRCPYIFNVSDLWPESAIQLGVLHNRGLIWLAERLEWSTYLKAARVMVVTKGIYATLERRGLPPERMFLSLIGVDTTRFRPLPRGDARAAVGWDDRFTVLYAGTIGLAHGLGTVLEAAELLRHEAGIRLVLMGDGAEKAHLLAEAQARGLENVTFEPPQPHDRMPLYIASADACLVSLRKLPLFEGALPSKLYEYMACGRPTLLAVGGEARDLAEREAGAGIAVEPENPAALAEAIRALRDQPELAQRLGASGRAFAEAHLDRAKLVADLEEHIAAALGTEPGADERLMAAMPRSKAR